jgi:hypothetical protein
MIKENEMTDETSYPATVVELTLKRATCDYDGGMTIDEAVEPRVILVSVVDNALSALNGSPALFALSELRAALNGLEESDDIEETFAPYAAR